MIWNAFLLAVREIRRNLMRAFLTVLGVVIGVAAVVTMVTLGNGATEMIRAQVSSLGSNLVILMPGQRGPGGPGNAPSFKEEDAAAILENVQGVQRVAPSSQRSASIQYAELSWSARITGATPDYFPVSNWTLASGRFFDDNEVKAAKPVCVIGETVRKELFGNSIDPVGEKVRFRGMNCEVIGLLTSKGQSAMGSDQDSLVVVPLETYQRRVAGRQSQQAVGNILISVADGFDSTDVMAKVSELMRERRRIAPGELDNFSVMDTREIANTLSATTRTLTALLGAVAAVSLLVGGIGIMNIMLVSVTERTREIGTRLAIGALEREVLLQFLVEAIVLSAFGGMIGILLALGATKGLASLMKMPFMFDPSINILAFCVAALIGVVFGYMPARRAARLDPIEALRHE